MRGVTLLIKILCSFSDISNIEWKYFWKQLYLMVLLEKNYSAIRVEFQVRGSPHVHLFICVLNSPKWTKSSIEEYTSWVDNAVRTDLPDPCSDPDLFELVKTYQIHRHSRTYRKYRNEKCRFHFGKFFTNRAIIAQPLSDSPSVGERNEIMENWKLLLKKVRQYIDT